MMSAALGYGFGAFDADHGASRSHDNMNMEIMSPVNGRATSTFRPLVAGSRASGVLQSRAATAGPSASSSEVHVCQQCRKRFDRLCDLNKHTKTHSRPFKCSYQECKYFSLGWPTAKELERHVNDKHLAAPETYPCYFPPCPYKSKRDSNRKQHMEKIHGWKYIRSKSNSRSFTRPEEALSGSLGLSAAHVPTKSSPISHAAAASPKTPFAQPRGDWVLYDQDSGQAAIPSYGSDAVEKDMPDADRANKSPVPDVVIPWTSPGTRLQRRKTDLQNFAQKFHCRPPQGGELPIGPRPMESRSVDSANTANLPPVTRNAKRETEQGTSFSEHAVPQQHGGSPYGGSLFAGVPQPGGQQMRARMLLPVKRKDDDDDDKDEDEDKPHPRKKRKSSPTWGFKDTQMPDIFHAAYPDIYNRDKKQVYSSCHTPHQDISTLVRHLSRAPHRLKATERYISSFEAQPQDVEQYLHTRVGVCRRCWQVYDNREDFSRHISAECDKVSKGKREKWQVLYDAFTPFLMSATSDDHVNGVNAYSHVRGRRSIGSAFGHMSVNDDTPHDAPSPTTIELGPPEHREPESPRLGEIEMRDREIKQLKMALRCMTGTVISTLSQNMGTGQIVHSHDVQHLRGLAMTFNNFLNQGQQSPAGDDRELLLGLGIQQTELPQGLMDDISSQQDVMKSQQPLSRSSSGLSSDRVTLCHVPNSPEARFEDFTEVGGVAEPMHPANPARDARSGPNRPISLLDSGYVSGNRSTLTDIDVERMKTIYSSYGENGPQGCVIHGVRPPITTYERHAPGQMPAEQSSNPSLPSSAMSPDCLDGQDEASQDCDYEIDRDILDDFGLSWSK